MKTYPVIIETPKDDQAKYAYDEQTGRFKLKKLLPAGMVFPFDFGFIEGTKGEDDAPLDIVVIAEFKSFAGCSMDCRIVGAIKAEQKEENELIRNDRFIGVPGESHAYCKIMSIRDLPGELLDQLEAFFTNYNKAEKKEFRVLQRIDAVKAHKIIDKNLKENGVLK
jgi:inorganic pyrophosphatase